jgi:hypothetical protein
LADEVRQVLLRALRPGLYPKTRNYQTTCVQPDWKPFDEYPWLKEKSNKSDKNWSRPAWIEK